MVKRKYLKNLLILLLGAINFLLIYCPSRPPKTFVRTMEPTWASIEIRKELSYEDAWNLIVDALAKKFDLEVISKEGGYVRTAWLYTWTGRVDQNYRVRAIIKFTPDRKKVEIKTEAEYGGPGKWVLGWDESLLTTLKSDIMGLVGRATR
ncbi:MAG: hypothetical protein ABIK77_08080 [candidate division WOR-3 bacterium]|uniref:DUF1499 domain-containing protein n=1 Tax=candidate division WOR-3 bacterium TaxID=2052148 RepID=A0A7V4CHH3_UNCW3|nr:hypothetical protein [Candidatus Omnitrophota bacterium]